MVINNGELKEFDTPSALSSRATSTEKRSSSQDALKD